MNQGVLAALMQAMKSQAHTAGASDDDGPMMPGDMEMQQAFDQPPGMGMGALDGDGGMDPSMQQGDMMGSPQMDPMMAQGQDFPLQQEPGDLWGPQQPQPGGPPPGGGMGSLQAMFGSPAMGGRMTSK